MHPNVHRSISYNQCDHHYNHHDHRFLGSPTLRLDSFVMCNRPQCQTAFERILLLHITQWGHVGSREAMEDFVTNISVHKLPEASQLWYMDNVRSLKVVLSLFLWTLRSDSCSQLIVSAWPSSDLNTNSQKLCCQNELIDTYLVISSHI